MPLKEIITMRGKTKLIYNSLMKKYLDLISHKNIPIVSDHPIWMKQNISGKPYWGVDNFCGMDRDVISDNFNLIELEWDGNEVYICGHDDIESMLVHGLGIILSWDNQLKKEYPNTSFDIMLYIDEGDNDVRPSIGLRFWAVRNNEHYINPSIDEDEKDCQPILFKLVNY